jgi:eukaryotic-like serine/threonine-protein kinase
LTPGTLIAAKYRLERLLGEGAMGVVWAAVNERTEREVALKLINGQKDDLRRRLLREARACGRLSHRNVIEILDVGETDSGDPFLVMPLLAGETLAERLERDGLLPPPLAARIGADIARGLEVAHAAGIVHRDLKPANVFLHREPGNEEDFVVKVLDFGVSKMQGPGDAAAATMAGSAVGSPLYMSPEQAIGDDGVGPRADLWTLGVLLFEMLTGTRPFYATTAFAVVAKILRGPIPTVLERAPGVDPALSAVVARCLVRRPAERIASAAELCALLLPFAGARERPPPPAPLPSPADDDEEKTSFFKKPAVNHAAEVMAAAEVLAAPEPLSTGDIVSSGELLSSADMLVSTPIEGTVPLPTLPLPHLGSPEAEAPAPPASSTTPMVQPGDPPPDEDADDAALAARWARPRRTGLWIALAVLSALVVAGGLYLGTASRPGVPAAAATTTMPHASAAPVGPPTDSPPITTATAAPPVASAAPAVPTAAVTSRGRSPGASPARPGGKIIRDAPF